MKACMACKEKGHGAKLLFLSSSIWRIQNHHLDRTYCKFYPANAAQEVISADSWKVYRAEVILRGKPPSFSLDPPRSAHWLILKIIMLCNSYIAHQGNFQVKGYDTLSLSKPKEHWKKNSTLNNKSSSICQEIPLFSVDSFSSTANSSFWSGDVMATVSHYSPPPVPDNRWYLL